MIELLFSIFACLAGIVVHTIKDSQRYAELTYWQYLVKYKLDIFATLLVCAVIVMSDFRTPDVLYSFSVGYAFNSNINWALGRNKIDR